MRHIKLDIHAALLASSALIMVGLPLQAADQDHRIEASAKSSYNFKTYLKDDHIKVQSSNGVVTLTGTVAHDYHKSLAQDTVSGLPGVKSVDNQLTVVGDQPSEHSDGWMTMKVKGVLAFHRNVSATATEVKTENGVVTLTGKADSEAQKQLTGEYAKDVEGVTEVRNNLVVTKGAHRTLGEKVDDTSITAQVKSALLFHKSTHALATKVVTKNGVVTLHGEAKNAAERDLVSKLAEDINGVKRVVNQMTVKPS
ncbi:BON domain-containing protein [Geothrix campi]|uniref:BON domain-containing protein n=1 Tax=Geothrix campi TaxID=2966450 RepID=UPI00214933E8|nr:BON domain-containing protein [Geothrix sp. SG10]